MPSKVYQITKTILDKNNKLRYQALTNDEKEYLEDYEEEYANGFPKNPTEEDNIKRNKYNRLAYQRDTNRETLEISRENVKQALNIKDKIDSEYDKISPVKRFFSHFVPDSWTKAGRIRIEKKECAKAFDDHGFSIERARQILLFNDMSSLGENAGLNFKAAGIEETTLFKSNINKKIHDLVMENNVGANIDVNVEDDPEDVDEKEQISVEEAANFNKQPKEFIQNSDNLDLSLNNNKEFEQQQLNAK